MSGGGGGGTPPAPPKMNLTSACGCHLLPQGRGSLQGPLEPSGGEGQPCTHLGPGLQGLIPSRFVKLQLSMATAVFLESQNVSRV